MRVHLNALTTLFIGGAALFSLAGRARAQSDIPITHFIFIIQENHSFDNYFGTFPNADGIPANTALPDYLNQSPPVHPILSRGPVGLTILSRTTTIRLFQISWTYYVGGDPTV
jgi:Phosphoesterase family